MYYGAGLHQVEVVEGSSHVQADGGDLVFQESAFVLEFSSHTGWHQLSEDDQFSPKSSSNKLQEVWVADTGCHVHFASE